MTNAEMKKMLNRELKRNGFSFNLIKEISEVGVNTCLKFNKPLPPLQQIWLNKRFTHGIWTTDTDHSIVFIKTPNDK